MKSEIKKTTTTTVDDVFNVLLFGLPQGMLLGVIWIVYLVWTKLGML